MKALIIVTVLAMATSAIAVPLSRQAKAQALLAAMQDNAQMEDLLSDIIAVVERYAPNENLVNNLNKNGLAALDAGNTRRFLLYYLERSLKDNLRLIEAIKARKDVLMKLIGKEKALNAGVRYSQKYLRIDINWLSRRDTSIKNGLVLLKNVINYLRKGLQ